MFEFLSLQFDTGRKVRAMNLCVAIRTSAVCVDIAACFASNGLVSTLQVALKTQTRTLGVEHVLMIRAVRIVAGETVFFNTRVFPQNRRLLFNVAFVAFVIN